MLTYIDVEYGANGELRRYQHPTLGIIAVVTMHGRNGGADIVNLHGAIEVAKGLLRFEAWEREQQERERRRAPRKREQRCRAPLELEPPSAAPQLEVGPPPAAVGRSRRRAPQAQDPKPAA